MSSWPGVLTGLAEWEDEDEPCRDNECTSGRQNMSGRFNSRIPGCSSRNRTRTEPKAVDTVVRPATVSDLSDVSKEGSDGDGDDVGEAPGDFADSGGGKK